MAQTKRKLGQKTTEKINRTYSPKLLALFYLSFNKGYYMPSAAIAAYNYDEQSHTLRVVFITGAVYDYLKVPVKVFKNMKNATSKGGYLNRYIKGHYNFEKVD